MLSMFKPHEAVLLRLPFGRLGHLGALDRSVAGAKQLFELSVSHVWVETLDDYVAVLL